ncbi:MAG: hypothetical protein AAF607_10705 [Pseudomonadota bacterium]
MMAFPTLSAFLLFLLICSSGLCFGACGLRTWPACCITLIALLIALSAAAIAPLQLSLQTAAVLSALGTTALAIKAPPPSGFVALGITFSSLSALFGKAMQIDAITTGCMSGFAPTAMLLTQRSGRLLLPGRRAFQTAFLICSICAAVLASAPAVIGGWNVAIALRQAPVMTHENAAMPSWVLICALVLFAVGAVTSLRSKR